MAHRDRSAGHAFMYVNIQDLLQQTKKIKTEESQSAPVKTQGQTTHQFTEAHQASQQVQGNLERLQALHHKLHVMLEELNKLTGKKDS